MKIILEQEDVHQAIRAHVSTLGVNLEGKHVNVNITSGRGDNGDSATIDITDAVDTAATPDPSTENQQELFPGA